MTTLKYVYKPNLFYQFLTHSILIWRHSTLRRAFRSFRKNAKNDQIIQKWTNSLKQAKHVYLMKITLNRRMKQKALTWFKSFTRHTPNNSFCLYTCFTSLYDIWLDIFSLIHTLSPQ